jgi:hypothetical protein
MSEQKRPTAGSVAPKSVPQADEIFLSPRVVDRQAFNDFAGQLRELIEQAGAAAEALRGAAGEAQRTRDSLRDAMNANQMKLDMATRALATIDQKAEQTRKMIDSASDFASRVDGLREQADQVITERVGILCQRLNEAEEAATAQVDELHARLAGTLTAADERESQLRRALEAAAGPLVGQLAELVERAEATMEGDAGLAAMVQRAECAGHAAASAAGELGAIRQQAEQARRILGEALNAAVPIIDEAGTIQGHLEATVSEAVRLTQTARESMTQFVAAQRAAVEQDAQRLVPLVEEARAETELMTRTTDAARSAAAEATAGAEQAARGLETLLQQVEPWRRVILGESEDAPVGAAINGMVVELKKEIRGVAGALRAIAERAESALEPQQAAVAPRAGARKSTARSAAPSTTIESAA